MGVQSVGILSIYFCWKIHYYVDDKESEPQQHMSGETITICPNMELLHGNRIQWDNTKSNSITDILHRVRFWLWYRGATHNNSHVNITVSSELINFFVQSVTCMEDLPLSPFLNSQPQLVQFFSISHGDQIDD